MSTMVTEHIVTEVGESFYTIKVDGTRDPTGRENISIVVRFINESYEPTERLLTIATADQGDAATLTDTIVEELSKAGLSPRRIINQVYDGASLMSGKHGGVQKQLQEKLQRDIPYVHCFNHQLHLVVSHALAAEQAVLDFFSTCNILYKFCRRPTVAILYKGERLKHLLEQRWTSHFGTVYVVLISFDDLVTLLKEIDSQRTYGADVRVEAAGLLRTMSEPSFRFIAEMVHSILSYLDPPNTMLQSEDMDLLTGALRRAQLRGYGWLDPEDTDFLDASKITPLLKLTNRSQTVDAPQTKGQPDYAFEKDLIKKFRSEWRDTVLRRFHSVAHRRLPLY
ncbi:hypothetical protein VZT92_014687 [Zoarces viviparus]|uniref:DUF4371 domain-containing protein n=1 Tax=Zoarces viviparus TaxID=48416 RepID=A0AAW1F024_ZOAVI